MKYWILAVSFLIFIMPIVCSAESQERKGQRLFAGCLTKLVDLAWNNDVDKAMGL